MANIVVDPLEFKTSQAGREVCFLCGKPINRTTLFKKLDKYMHYQCYITTKIPEKDRPRYSQVIQMLVSKYALDRKIDMQKEKIQADINRLEQMISMRNKLAVFNPFASTAIGEKIPAKKVETPPYINRIKRLMNRDSGSAPSTSDIMET